MVNTICYMDLPKYGFAIHQFTALTLWKVYFSRPNIGSLVGVPKLGASRCFYTSWD